ncbi:MAG: exostosin family protein [Stigonema ocellatum SAG 48.90 = DSM 106950]|nr:exostosin family protein [Stigonema ocellatum SAG 48.90 = DSM 106950]
MNNTKKVKIVAFDMGPGYYHQIRDGLVARGIDCAIKKVKTFCLHLTFSHDKITRLREDLRKENNELVVFIPSVTELFLEEPDLSIMFSGFNSWCDRSRVRIIPYLWSYSEIWSESEYSKLPELPDLKEIKWTTKPDLSVGFLGNSHRSRKIVKLAANLPNFLKQQILQGRQLRYLYTSRHEEISTRLAWMPCFVRMEVIKSLEEAKDLKTDLVTHVYGGSSKENKNYQNHMMRNTYILCPRGYENFSMRFYEALAYGRVPILIDTDMMLPPNVDWDEVCLRVPYKNLSQLEKIIKNDYETKTERDFLERQEKALKVVEEMRTMNWLQDIIEQIAKASQ